MSEDMETNERPWDASGRSDEASFAAARWYDRLEGAAVSPQERAQFEAWYAASAQNRGAYGAVQRGVQIARRSAQHPALQAIGRDIVLRAEQRRSRGRAARAAGFAAIGISLLIAAVLGRENLLHGAHHLVDNFSGEGGRAQLYSTKVGERLEIPLGDGSKITLNTDSAVQSTYTRSERRILLSRGQALFEVAKDPERPFTVEARGRRLVALGTSFDVRMLNEQIQVTLLEGSVRVEAAQERSILKQGDQVTIGARRATWAHVADPDRVSSWSRGQIFFDNSPLPEAVAEINRYSDTKVEIADAQLRDLRITGAFSSGRPAVFAEALAAYFPIEVTKPRPERLVLHQRRPQR